MTKIPVLTIDGPSGSGKGTVSRWVARELGWHFLDSGAIYRCLALAAGERGISLDDEDSLAACALEMKLDFSLDEPPRVHLEGSDVTDELGLESTANAASKVAQIPKVRAALLDKQRSYRIAPGLVADGRDMGTVVFPDAACKVFLTASPKVRALRRHKQLKAKGIDVNLDDLTSEVEERDRRDRERSTAPLVMAESALLIDSSDLAIPDVIQRILNEINQTS